MNVTHVFTLFYTNFSFDATLFYMNFSLDATLFYTSLSFFGCSMKIGLVAKILYKK